MKIRAAAFGQRSLFVLLQEYGRDERAVGLTRFALPPGLVIWPQTAKLILPSPSLSKRAQASPVLAASPCPSLVPAPQELVVIGVTFIPAHLGQILLSGLVVCTLLIFHGKEVRRYRRYR